MLTRTEIEDESATVDATTIEMVMAEIRSSTQYNANPGLFSDLETKLTAASGTVKGRMVNAVVTKLSEIGAGVASLQGGQDALYFSQKDEKAVWHKYLLNLFYRVSDGVVGVDISTVDIDELIALGLLTDFKSGQRTPTNEFIN